MTLNGPLNQPICSDLKAPAIWLPCIREKTKNENNEEPSMQSDDMEVLDREIWLPSCFDFSSSLQAPKSISCDCRFQSFVKDA